MFTNMYKHKSRFVYIRLRKDLSLIDIVTEDIGSVLHRITIAISSISKGSKTGRK